MFNIPPKGITPNKEEIEKLTEKFPNLHENEWSKTGEATGIWGPNAYNCYAWSLCRDDIGWIEQIIDALGNNNKILDVEDFDNFYKNKGYTVCGNSLTECNPEYEKRKIAIFCKDGKPMHAAKEAEDENWWESKLGSNIRIMHKLGQLEGEQYGEVCRCYHIIDKEANCSLKKDTKNLSEEKE